MNFKNYILAFLCLLSISMKAQNPVLVGYWQNWNDSNAPYIPLNQIDSRYTIICVSFAVPTSPSDMNMLFSPDGVSQSTLISQIQALQAQGKKVLLSIGGATTSISLNTIQNRDAFINSMLGILNTYHFDGIDIDIEHGDSILATGTISNPTSGASVNLINAISQIKSQYFTTFNVPMMLTFAPETAYVQGGMSAYGGIWGGYLPILDALRNDIDYIHVQLYNSGSIYGIDGVVYNQGTADFIIAMTEALIHGFPTAGGNFDGFPADKVVVGLPACPNAAGGGFTSSNTVTSAIQYLRGTGPKPGTYTLSQVVGYPNLGGMMTWSINWDKVATCNAISYEYAENFEAIFGAPLASVSFSSDKISWTLAPNPATNELFVKGNKQDFYKILSIQGQLIQEGKINSNTTINITNLKSGLYFISIDNDIVKFIKE
ncbi:glycosyl hydrolase family 18 protein [Flavobacterium sp.]|uniref:glycosyl hydrolase family 18 protein n=1 Tax=Flavobacterium sp. TaxID=239 RepID=UPI00286CECFD|nr:glycosyl hydrolase family 18 protein [Flavobacterium sp.]